MLPIQVRNALVRVGDDPPQVVIREQGGDRLPLFNVRVYVEGPSEEVDRIDHVVYKLHPTFVNPVRTTKDRARAFEMTTWAWGEFTMQVEVYTSDGQVFELEHMFQFFDQVKATVDGGTPFVDAETGREYGFK